MVSRRKSGGRFDFVASDNELEPLDNKLGRHAKIGGRQIERKSKYEESLPVFDASLEKQRLELKAQRQNETEDFLNKYGKPSLGQRIKHFFR